MKARITPVSIPAAAGSSDAGSPAVMRSARAIAGSPESGSRSRAIGEIIQRMNALSDVDLERIIEYQKQCGVRFGEAAVALEMATPSDVAWALSCKFDYAYPRLGSDACDPELIVARDPFSEQAEAFRQLRSELLSGVMGARAQRNALAVVSPGRGDGRSFMAANLALAFSQLGQKTLIVDGDLRTPRLARLFRIQSHLGLSSLLAGHHDGASAEPAPGLDNLHVLVLGTLPPNPLELLHRGHARPLFDELLNSYEHVIVDTSAGQLGTDNCVMAAHCGAALVVGRQDVTPLRDLDATLAKLDTHAVAVAGVLINRH